jgi:LysM repeat protein
MPQSRNRSRLFIFLRRRPRNPILPPMKNTFRLLPLAVGLALTGVGCTTVPERDAPPPASQADVGYLREEIRRLTARIDSSEAELGRVQGDVMASQSSQPAYASSAQLQSVQTQLDDLQRQIRALDAARAQDKKEVYDDISKKIATLLKSAPAASSSSSKSSKRSASGIEHVVQPGESLSKIAAAYGVTMAIIVQENGLASPDSIRVGQKLFIPD